MIDKDAHIVNEMPKELRKDDAVVRKASLIALKKARMFQTDLAVGRDGGVDLCSPDIFEKNLPKDVKN